MNNDAFKNLVRSQVKDTKQIAREAVESEYRRREKKRKGRGKGNDSSDDDDSDSGGRKERKTVDKSLWPVSAKLKESNNTSADAEDTRPKYRDRAKERREGKNKDYDASKGMLESVTAQQETNTAELSKYLGGDEAHTHLVKGLDLALARSVKAEMQDKVLEEALSEGISMASKTTTLHRISSRSEAVDFIKEVSQESVTSILGQDVLDYLRHTKLGLPRKSQPQTVTRAGFALQRTELTFSIRADPRNKLRAWEIPKEGVQAASISHRNRPFEKASLVEESFIDKIQKALDARVTIKKQTMMVDSSKDVNVDKSIEDSDDDDIFGNVGEYVPPSKTSKSPTS